MNNCCILLLTLTLLPAIASAEYQLRHDPFEKPIVAQSKRPRTVASNSKMEVKGVILDGRNSMANINGNFVKLNDEVAGYRVTRIERDRVVLMKNSITTILSVNNDEK